MNWMFITDLAFYAVMGFLTFPMVVLIYSLLRGKSFDDAYKDVKAFLSKWAAIQPRDFVDRVLRVTGITTVAFLLGFGAYLANRVGDAGMPYTASWFGYFGSEQVRWANEHHSEWKRVLMELRTVSGIEHDRVKWEEAKAQAGKFDVRLFRTVAVLSLVVAISGLIALFRASTRGAAAVTLIVGLLGTLGSHALWAEREDQYMENVIARYASEYRQVNENALPTRPAFHKGWWPEPSRIVGKSAEAVPVRRSQ